MSQQPPEQPDPQQRRPQSDRASARAPSRERDLAALLGKVKELDLHLDLPVVRSPSQPERGRIRPRRHSPGVFGLWLLSTPLLLGAVISLAAGHFDGFLGKALGWGLIALGAMLTRRGGDTDADGEDNFERRFSRRLRLPLRNLGGLSVAAGVAVAAAFGLHYSVPVGIAFGALAALAFHLIYRFEPLLAGEKLAADDRESRQVAEALAEAEDRLITIERAARAVGNPELTARLSRIAAEGRSILAQIAERPSDLRRARRFLTVFLEGAEQVSDGYVRTHHHADSPELEQNFRTVLGTIEEQFRRQRERLRQADVLDLDVQIEVLKKQLEQEGIR
jgi:5-bromo-4-chloroindolyl phosphate hydrolysis protein